MPVTLTLTDDEAYAVSQALIASANSPWCSYVTGGVLLGVEQRLRTATPEPSPTVEVRFTIRAARYCTGSVQVDPKRFAEVVGKPFDIETLNEGDLAVYTSETDTGVVRSGPSIGDEDWIDFETGE